MLWCFCLLCLDFTWLLDWWLWYCYWYGGFDLFTRFGVGIRRLFGVLISLFGLTWFGFVVGFYCCFAFWDLNWLVLVFDYWFACLLISWRCDGCLCFIVCVDCCVCFWLICCEIIILLGLFDLRCFVVVGVCWLGLHLVLLFVVGFSLVVWWIWAV